jgi:Pectate lyase superfamily protein
MRTSFTKYYFMNHLLIALQLFSISNISCNKVYSTEKEDVQSAIVLTTIGDLRKSFVRENIIYRTSDFGGGDWTYDVLDGTSQDNTGTILVTILGQRLKRTIQGFINVKWFGARGDSVTDETDAFNEALSATHLQKQNLYIPAGIYSCNKIDKNQCILSFDAGTLDNITIYGDGPNSKITTSSNSSSLLFYIFAYNKNNNLTIRNLYFESIHPVMLNYSHGIMIQGTKGENFINTLISECKFEGFSTSIIGQGLNGVAISKNVFNAPLGHDNAQNNSSPAVFIWFFDDKNGYCSDIQILNNNANGYSGNKPVNTLFSKRPMDGFVYGTGYGYLISENNTKYFSEEHISISPQSTFPNSSKQIIISNNELDGRIPIGSENPDGSVHANNYGIRCDASNSSITNNTILDFKVGIMVRTFDYPAIRTERINISNNTLVSVNDQQNCQISCGISVQGSVLNRLHNITLEKNNINVINARAANIFNGIAIYDTDSAYVENNQISVANLTPNNYKNNFGIFYGRVAMIYDMNNLITGITSHNNLNSNDQVTFKSNGE